MLYRVTLAVALVLVVTVISAFAQGRFGNEHGGRFKGFTKSIGEHIMNEFDGVPELRSVRGQIVEESSGVGLQNAIFELRREDPDARVRGVRTKADGRFQIGGLAAGTYVFKVTLDGFQSVYGRLIVTKKAAKRNTLRIELKHGV